MYRKRNKCEDSPGFPDLYFCHSFQKKLTLLMVKEWAAANASLCARVTGVSEPVGAGTNCFLHLQWQQWARSSVQSPVMHFGLLGVAFWFFNRLQLLPGYRCACFMFLAIVSYKYLQMLCANSALLIPTLHSLSVAKTCSSVLPLVCYLSPYLLSHLEKWIKWCW